MHATNTWFDVLDAALRVHSNAIIPDAIGALLQEIFASERPESLAELASAPTAPPICIAEMHGLTS
jgi:hypothetical protein